MKAVRCLQSALWLLAIPLLALPFVGSVALDAALTALFCLLGAELAVALYGWCFRRDNWPAALASAWLYACALGAFLAVTRGWPVGAFSSGYFAYFLWLMLLGYAALRFGMRFAGLVPGVAAKTESLARLCSPEIALPRRHVGFMQLLCLATSLGVLAIYWYYGCFPALTEEPALYRYKYFNGPYTNSLIRFVFRSLSAVSLVSLLYLVVFFRHALRAKTLFLSTAVIILASFCAFAHGSSNGIPCQAGQWIFGFQ